MWRAEGEAVREAGLQVHLPACGAREVVAEEEVDVVPLVGGLRDALPVESHLRLHDSEADPGVGARHELAEELEVGPHHVSRGAVVAVVDDFHVVHVVGVQAALGFVVEFGGELERPSRELELVFHGRQYLEGALRLDALVELHGGGAVCGHRVAEFLVEGALVIEPGGQAEGEGVVGRRHVSQAHPGAEEPLPVPGPVAEPGAVVHAQYAGLVLGAVGVLGVDLGVAGGDAVVALQVVDDAQRVAGVRHAVSAAVPVLPLPAVLADALAAPGDAGLQVVAGEGEAVGGLHVGRAAVEEVACVLHVGAHAQLLVPVRLVEPVLSLDVVGFLLPGAECRCREAHAACLACLAGEAEGAEEGAEEVALLSVEVYAEVLHVLHRAEAGLAAGGLEAVVVLADVGDGVHGPVLGGRPAGVGLVVQESRLVLALGLQAAQHVLVGLVAHAVAEGDLPVAVARVHVGTEQAGLHAGLVPLGAGVGDVEHAAHPVAVLGLEAARAEVHLLHHVAVYHREALLLAAADEQGAVDLPPVDVHAVLVERSAAHVVLAGELVVGAHAGLRGHELLHGVARGAGHAPEVLGAEFLRGAHLAARVGHHHLLHLLAAALHDHVEREPALRLPEHAPLFLESHHAEGDDHAVGRVEREAVLPVHVGRGGRQPAGAHHAEGHGVALLVHHAPLQVDARRVRPLGLRQADEGRAYIYN